MHSVTSNAVAKELRQTLAYFIELHNTTAWGYYIPQYRPFEYRGVSGKTVYLKIGVPRYQTPSIQISWGQSDIVTQFWTGDGRTTWQTIDDSTPFVVEAHTPSFRTYELTYNIPNGSDVFGITPMSSAVFINSFTVY
jgi:hypothetical protein